MRWPKIFAKHPCLVGDYDEEDSEDIRLAEQRLREAKRKLAETRSKTNALNRAVASARRVSYKVDKFTKEIEQTFRGADGG